MGDITGDKPTTLPMPTSAFAKTWLPTSSDPSLLPQSTNHVFVLNGAKNPFFACFEGSLAILKATHTFLLRSSFLRLVRGTENGHPRESPPPQHHLFRPSFLWLGKVCQLWPSSPLSSGRLPLVLEECLRGGQLSAGSRDPLVGASSAMAYSPSAFPLVARSLLHMATLAFRLSFRFGRIIYRQNHPVPARGPISSTSEDMWQPRVLGPLTSKVGAPWATNFKSWGFFGL